MTTSATASVTTFTSRYPPASDASGSTKPAAKTLKAKESKLESDVRNKRCDDIIQNDKTAIARAAAAPGATSASPTAVNTARAHNGSKGSGFDAYA